MASPPRWPGYQASSTRRDLVQPGHEHRTAGLQHHDGVRIGRGDRRDQGVLIVAAGGGPAASSPSRQPLGGEDQAPRRPPRRPRRRRWDRRRPHSRPCAQGSVARMAASGGDGVEDAARPRRRPGAGSERATPPVGTTWDEPPPDRTPDVRMAADHPIRGGLGERQDAALVLEQDDAVLGHRLRHGGIGVRCPSGAASAGRRARRLRTRANRMRRTMSSSLRLRDLPGAMAAFRGSPKKTCLVELLAQFLVEAGHDGRHVGMDRAPVGHHEARIAPVRLQHLVRAASRSRRHRRR